MLSIIIVYCNVCKIKGWTNLLAYLRDFYVNSNHIARKSLIYKIVEPKFYFSRYKIKRIIFTKKKKKKN